MAPGDFFAQNDTLLIQANMQCVLAGIDPNRPDGY
jgi:hypothetical protein